MKTKAKLPNAAIALLRRKHVGVRELGRAAGVSHTAASRWFEGSAKPESARRAAIVEALGVPAELWDQSPTKNNAAKALASETNKIIENSAVSGAAADSIIFVPKADDPAAEVARLRAATQTAVDDGAVGLALQLEGTLLRTLRRQAVAAGETGMARRLATHPKVAAIVSAMLGGLAAHPDARASFEAMLARHGVPCAPREATADLSGPHGARDSIAALRARVAQLRAAADGSLQAKVLNLESRAADALARIDGSEAELLESPVWRRFRTDAVESLKHWPEALRAALDAMAEDTQKHAESAGPGPHDVVLNAACSQVCCNPVKTADEIREHRRRFALGGKVIWTEGPPCQRLGVGGTFLADHELPEPFRTKYLLDRKRQAAEYQKLDEHDRVSSA